MKLRNKKTGEITNLSKIYDKYSKFEELLEEWEDYEELEEIWTITTFGEVQGCNPEEDIIPVDPRLIDKLKEIGNYFETKEEAEKAVEKLKALAEIKKCGFKFTKWDETISERNLGAVIFEYPKGTWDKYALNLLFGGKE